jgi:hypothetical protein
MEVDFDKEIDTLLRKAQRDGPVYVGDFASQGHLDADQISAFAENATPEKSRALYSAHLADCDRCRKILSNVLMMNAEAIPAAESPSAITIAERAAEPWYKRLFLFPNLAYLMGGLVLVFSGFLGYTVIQRSNPASSSIISQVSESDPRGGPNFQSEPELQTDTEMANMANLSSNSAANTAIAIPNAAANSNSSPGSAPLGDNAAVGGARSPENSFVLDGTSAADATVAPAPPPTVTSRAAPKDAKEREEDARSKMVPEEQAAGANIQELARKEAIQKQQQYKSVPSQSGPMTNNQSQYNRQLEKMDASAAEKRKAAARDGDSSGRRSVAGRTFERKQGVWYDSAYQGSVTINVRRGSVDFNRLDGGLRSIADSLGGTVVVVWGTKAYRIQ